VTRRDLIRLEEEREIARDFSAHVFPPCEGNSVLPVSDEYDYLRRGFFKRLASFFAVGAFRFVGLFIGGYCRLKVEGKRNLRGVRGAILTSNHINNVDCVLIRRAVGRRKLKITVAEFNNRRGAFGGLLRSAGTVPIGKTLPTMRHLNAAITEFLKRDQFVLFYPEGSLWWCYEKPRPLIEGAFLSAAKNGAPVIPMFFTFRERGKRRDGTPKKSFTLHIGKPLLPNPGAPLREEAKRLADLAWEYNVKTYEEAYGKPLEYL